MSSTSSPYQLLASHFDKIGDLEDIAEISSWDEATVMPEGGGRARGKSLATLSGTIHELKTDQRIKEWLSLTDGDNSLDSWQKANVLEIKKIFKEASAIPVELAKAIELSSSKSEQAWRHHRADNDWTSMQPHLTALVGLVRERASILASTKQSTPYDALLDQYEPGVTAKSINTEFNKLKTFLPDFISEVEEAQNSKTTLPINGRFPLKLQERLGKKIMGVMGFDFNRGRLDISHHPFCGGIPDDTRITTRYNEENFTESLMGVIHETGHALYQQGLPTHWRNQPVGEARSMAMHESQSLIMEMQACRSAEFLSFLTPLVQDTFAGEQRDSKQWSTQNLKRLYLQVKRDFIRVDADELTYPLHIILRFEIERDLINGDIEVKDIPELWDLKMFEYLSLDTKGNFRDGCLQDVHWPSGLFGYFPSYTIGAMTAAQLFRSAKNSKPTLLSSIEDGDFSELVDWLRVNIHSRASCATFDQLLVDATNEKLNSQHFADHLKLRYRSAL